MHMGAKPVRMFQVPFQELVTGRSATLYSSDTQPPSLPLQENWEVHPTHRSVLGRNMASGLPHFSPPWPGFHEIINKRSQTPMSHLIVHSYRPNSKLYQQHFCHGREKSVQVNSFPPFRLGLSCRRFCCFFFSLIWPS